MKLFRELVTAEPFLIEDLRQDELRLARRTLYAVMRKVNTPHMRWLSALMNEIDARLPPPDTGEN